MMASWEGDLAAATIDPEVFALRPDYVAVLIVARGLVPGDPSVASEEALCEAETVAAQALEGVEAHDLPTIAEWRSAFAAFGVKPREARSSAEALLRRVGAGLPRIDRLTDIYNAVSVIHQTPIGLQPQVWLRCPRWCRRLLWGSRCRREVGHGGDCDRCRGCSHSGNQPDGEQDR